MLRNFKIIFIKRCRERPISLAENLRKLIGDRRHKNIHNYGLMPKTGPIRFSWPNFPKMSSIQRWPIKNALFTPYQFNGILSFMTSVGYLGRVSMSWTKKWHGKGAFMASRWHLSIKFIAYRKDRGLRFKIIYQFYW